MMKKEHIVLLKSNLSGEGGLEKYTLYTAHAFYQQGCDVTILTTGPVPKTTLTQKVEMISLGAIPKLSFWHLLQFDRACNDWLRKTPCRIVLGMDRNSFQTHYRAGNGVHRAYLAQRSLVDPLWKKLSFLINPLHRTILKLEREAFESQFLESLFTNSQMVREEILQHYNVSPDNVQVIHNGVEWNSLLAPFGKWEEKRKELLSSLKLDPSTHQFLFVGHEYQRKGLTFLLQSLALIKNESWQLSVVGKDKNLKAFKELALQLGISKCVFFFGSQNHVISFYQIADTLVIPSIYDPCANVTLEALAMGLHVVSSKSNGAHEILTPSSGNVIETLEDPLSFKKALLAALNIRKTPESAEAHREIARPYQFKNQLKKLILGILTKQTIT